MRVTPVDPIAHEFRLDSQELEPANRRFEHAGPARRCNLVGTRNLRQDAMQVQRAKKRDIPLFFAQQVGHTGERMKVRMRCIGPDTLGQAGKGFAF